MTLTFLSRAATGALLSLALAGSVAAAPVLLIDATTDGLAPAADFSNVAFSLTFEDSNLDALFSLDELLAFTGVFDSGGQFYDTLLGVPTVPGITGNNAGWLFGDGNGQLADLSTAAATYTAFSSAAVDASVPEPASWALVLAALTGLAGLRRRR